MKTSEVFKQQRDSLGEDFAELIVAAVEIGDPRSVERLKTQHDRSLSNLMSAFATHEFPETRQ